MDMEDEDKDKEDRFGDSDISGRDRLKLEGDENQEGAAG